MQQILPLELRQWIIINTKSKRIKRITFFEYRPVIVTQIMRAKNRHVVQVL